MKTEAKPESKTGVLPFFQQVRQEVSKVTWPSRSETVVTTIMVFIMVTLFSIFFFLADQALSWLVGSILGAFS